MGEQPCRAPLRRPRLGAHPMRMLVVAVTMLALMVPSPTAPDGGPIDLRVLYAGNPGSDRERDFTSFLGRHFARVGTTDYERFKEADAQGYDVVIFDWTSLYPRDQHGKVRETYDRLDS